MVSLNIMGVKTFIILPSIVLGIVLGFAIGPVPAGFGATASAAAPNQAKHNYIPPSGYVPDEKTAVSIAEAVWLPIYGDRIYGSKPFKARLHDGVWFVEGTLPKNWIGGVPEAEISKQDGRILRVSHGK